ncbi:MAG: chemotaxis protein CheA, partial [Candidatus Eisenbacteria bacterium]
APPPAPAPVAAERRERSERADDPGAASPARRFDDGQASVKVDTRKLDNLVDMVGELVIVQSIIQSHPGMTAVADDALGRQMAQLRRISSELQRNAMAMRMVPIRQTFQKMARLVRDLTRKSGKKVELTLVGEDTELDRRVVEDITDPLMHMVRNSVDHGLESPEARLAGGKSDTGKLTLCAYHQGGNIVIGIIDDGKGLDVDRIRAKAVANGLITEADQPSAAELHQMIFRPGFSTAEKVTEVSGRGVGMDVVRRNIEALRGWIEIQTEPGQGTTFYIKLPLTLAIVDGLVLSIGRERYVLPTFAIRESLRPTREQVHTVQGQAMVVQVRDRLVPILPLGEHFGLDEYRASPWEAAVVIVEDDGRQVGLLVDDLLGKQEVVIKSLGPTFAGVAGVSGGAILGDGRVGLILDVHAIVGQSPAELARMV